MNKKMKLWRGNMFLLSLYKRINNYMDIFIFFIKNMKFYTFLIENCY